MPQFPHGPYGNGAAWAVMMMKGWLERSTLETTSLGTAQSPCEEKASFCLHLTQKAGPALSLSSAAQADPEHNLLRNVSVGVLAV